MSHILQVSHLVELGQPGDTLNESVEEGGEDKADLPAIIPSPSTLRPHASHLVQVGRPEDALDEGVEQVEEDGEDEADLPGHQHDDRHHACGDEHHCHHCHTCGARSVGREK